VDKRAGHIRCSGLASLHFGYKKAGWKRGNMMTEKKLEYFRMKLLQKREWLADMMHRSEQHALETDAAILDTADTAVAVYTKEFMFGKNSADFQILLSVGEALDSLERHSYGFCQCCEEEIDFKRLDAVPWTRFCLQCQSRLEKSEPVLQMTTAQFSVRH
jgi:DnaK suppressor protein